MRVLVIGASGYLGGAVALRLVRDGHAVTALVRDIAKAEPMTRAGLALRPGSLDDAADLKRAVADADAVINAADSDHAPGVTAILEAIAGTAKTFIHTSGISVTGDRAAGAGGGIIRDEDTVYEPIPERAARYAIDATVRGAASRGCRPMVVCCPLVYGPPAWPGRESVQLPHLVSDARERGVARYIGAGEARWSYCHIDDIAEAYALALANGHAGGLYYPESGEQSWASWRRASAACWMCRLQPGRWTRRLPPGDRVRCGPTAPMRAPAGCKSAKSRVDAAILTISMRTFADWQVKSSER